jgi:hypothetical protein
VDKWRNLAGGAALALLLSGCGGAVAAAPTVASTPLPMPACAGGLTPTPLPPDFPPAFPFPPGAVLTVGRDMGNGGRVVGGFAPGGIDTARAWLDAALPGAGFEVTHSEAESSEAEGDFKGQGVAGRWRVGKLNKCDGAVSITVLTRR